MFCLSRPNGWLCLEPVSTSMIAELPYSMKNEENAYEHEALFGNHYDLFYVVCLCTFLLHYCIYCTV